MIYSDNNNSTTLLYLPDYMDINSPCIWWCMDADDLYTLKNNAVCKATLANWCETEQYREIIESFQFILVCAPPGETRDEIVSELTNRFVTPVLIPQENAFYGTNNIRELLESKGAWAVSRLLYGATEVPMQGILNIADIDCTSQKNTKTVLSGIRLLDSEIGGFASGELSVWTGKRGEGKSTLLGQILLESVNQGHKVCAYSGELKAAKFKLSIMQQAAGFRNVIKRQDERSGKIVYDIKPDAEKAINEWWRGRLFLTDIRKDNAHDEDNILHLFEYTIRKYGCDVFLVDNIMMAQLKDVARVGYWQAQSLFTGRLVAFAKAHDVHVHLVAHPRKTDKKLDADDVGGSVDITNKADNVFKIERVREDAVEQLGYSTILTVLKNRDDGALPKIELEFNPASRRFFQRGMGDRRVFSWEKAVISGGN